jgi:hypothetical protein
MKITVEIKNNYGRRYVYPACEISRIFAALVQRTTLTDRDLEHIKRLGYSIEVSTQAVAL